MMDDADKLTAIAKIKETESRDATAKKVYNLDRIASRASAKAKTEAETNIYDYIIASKGLGPNGKPIDLKNLPMDPVISGVDQVPDLKDAYKKLDVGQRERLQAIINGQIEGDKPVSEKDDITNAGILMNLIATDKEKFLGTNFALEYYGKMTPERIRFFQNLKRITREGDAKGENSGVSWTQQISSRLGKLGWIGDDYARHRGDAETKIMDKIIQHRVKSNP